MLLLKIYVEEASPMIIPDLEFLLMSFLVILIYLVPVATIPLLPVVILLLMILTKSESVTTIPSPFP